MPHESLSPEDATLLVATDPRAQLQIGAVCFFDGAPLRDGQGRLRLHDLRSHIEARLGMSPRFRQRVATIAFDAARPVWLDDEAFDIANHVRAHTLPAPGGRQGLRDFLRELLSGPLDPDRPLWEAWVVDGIVDDTTEGTTVDDDPSDDRVAVVLRVHHVMADGLSLLDAALLLLDAEPHDHPDEPTAWKAEPTPGTDRLLLEALAARTRHQVAIALGALGALASMADPRRALGGLRTVAGTVAGTATSGIATAPALPLNGRVGTRRDFTWASLSMPDLVEVKRAQKTTLNDVVLAVVAGALKRHLGSDEAAALAEHPPRVLVPVGSFDAAETGEAGNAFSIMVTELPFDTDDPLEQLADIHAQMDQLKDGGQSSASSSLFSVIDLLPLPLLRRLGPLALSRQPFVNLAVTNIPGSRSPAYLLGARMHELHPIVTGVGNIALIIGVLSYVDHMGVGITVDPDVVEDPDGLLADIEDAAAALVEASRRKGKAKGKAKSTRRVSTK